MAQKLDLPDLATYIEGKTKINGGKGRDHFLLRLAKMNLDVEDEILNIIERAWVKDDSIYKIVKYYRRQGIRTSYHTIYRLLGDLKPFTASLIKHLEEHPRRRSFYNPELNTSDYETVAAYIRRAKRAGLRNWKRVLQNATRAWKALNRKDPRNWTGEEVQDYLATLLPVASSGVLDAIRQVAPQIAEPTNPNYISVLKYRDKIKLRKKDIFGEEVKLIRNALTEKDMTFELIVFDLHITTGCREGSTDTKSGICGLSWDRFKKNYTIVDDYESKVRQGIFWRNCPVDQFFADLPTRLRELWRDRGKPTTDKLILNGYKELLAIYKRIRTTLAAYYDGKLDPYLLKEFSSMVPHDADKIHCNLLWEAGVPLEVVAGQFQGRGEGLGLVGRGWLSTDIIKKHYLSLTQRSERFKKLRQQITDYSERFR